VDWIHLAQNRLHRRALVNTATNLYKVRNVLTSWASQGPCTVEFVTSNLTFHILHSLNLHHITSIFFSVSYYISSNFFSLLLFLFLFLSSLPWVILAAMNDWRLSKEMTCPPVIQTPGRWEVKGVDQHKLFAQGPKAVSESHITDAGLETRYRWILKQMDRLKNKLAGHRRALAGQSREGIVLAPTHAVCSVSRLLLVWWSLRFTGTNLIYFKTTESSQRVHNICPVSCSNGSSNRNFSEVATILFFTSRHISKHAYLRSCQLTVVAQVLLLPWHFAGGRHSTPSERPPVGTTFIPSLATGDQQRDINISQETRSSVSSEWASQMFPP
jgi:hypothetical protein